LYSLVALWALGTLVARHTLKPLYSLVTLRALVTLQSLITSWARIAHGAWIAHASRRAIADVVCRQDFRIGQLSIVVIIKTATNGNTTRCAVGAACF
tara:strand:+ start:14421 stop:14711 length:291 start_codon:yes stop_codon:yes gene_type:complete